MTRKQKRKERLCEAVTNRQLARASKDDKKVVSGLPDMLYAINMKKGASELIKILFGRQNSGDINFIERENKRNYYG